MYMELHNMVIYVECREQECQTDQQNSDINLRRCNPDEKSVVIMANKKAKKAEEMSSNMFVKKVPNCPYPKKPWNPNVPSARDPFPFPLRAGVVCS